MFLFQLLAIVFGLFMMYVIRIHFRKGHFEKSEFWSWILVWSSFIFLSLFPQTIRFIAESLHIGRVFDAIVILAFMVLSSVVFANRIDIKKLEKKLEEKVRAKAINEMGSGK